MKILWMTWKDRSHPEAGGAEVVNEELAKRLALEGHEVVFLVGSFAGAPHIEKRDGFFIVRMGGKFSVYAHAYRYYKKHVVGWPDFVIDEVNTIPFFARLYVKEKTLLFFHQLAREIWFYQMIFPFSGIGYLLEPLYLRLLALKKRTQKYSSKKVLGSPVSAEKRPSGPDYFLQNASGLPTVVTVSESTKDDLLQYGFESKRVHIISEGIELEPLSEAEFTELQKIKLESLKVTPTVLVFGAVRPMKQTLQIIKAFELLKKSVPQAKLVIAGSTEGNYAKKLVEYVNHSPHADDIHVLGRVSKAKKIALMQTAHVLAVASVKEGWGLVVTEANSQGTPAVVYNVDGLRDSVEDGVTGIVSSENTPTELARALSTLLLSPDMYTLFRKNAWEWSQKITFEKSFEDFKKVLGL